MIKGFEHVGTDHKCNVCTCEFTEDEGGVLGYFGILPVAFCPTCYSSMVDMVSQDLDLELKNDRRRTSRTLGYVISLYGVVCVMV